MTAAFLSKSTSQARDRALLTIALLLMGGADVSRAQTLDSFNPNAGLTVLAAVVQPDGKIVIGGDFTTLAPNGGPTITRNHIARLNSDGTVDLDFNPNANGSVHAVAVQADGKILAAGIFTTIGGQSRNYIARLDAVTGQADSFDPSANLGTSVESIAVQPDGKVLIGGNFTNLAPNGGMAVFRARIARLNESGTLDSSFGLETGANNTVNAIVVRPSGNVLVGGQFTNINGQPRSYVAKLFANGLPDTTFNAGTLTGPFGFAVQSLAVQGDGKVIIVGSFTGIQTPTRNRIARLDGTTGVVDSFDPNANNTLFAVTIQNDGRILVGGGFSGTNSIGGAARNRIARLDPATGLADSFNPDAENVVFAIPLQSDGKILLAGSFITMSGQTRHRMARVGSFQLINALSRKEHGASGVFDINLPLTGPPGLECRSSGGNHSLVLTFSNPVISGNAAVTSGIGTVASTAFNANTMTINLTGVADFQSVTVTLSGVTDASAEVLPDMPLRINFLIGDTNGNSAVNAGDVSQTKSRIGQMIDATNFRSDINANGTVNATDASQVKAKLGNALPP